MDKDAEIRNFIKAIRKALPNATEKTDAIMHERGFESDQEAEYLWVEALADVTNNAISMRLKNNSGSFQSSLTSVRTQ